MVNLSGNKFGANGFMFKLVNIEILMKFVTYLTLNYIFEN